MPTTERVAALAATPTPVLPPLSLYVHLPWCVRKCPYCDFNSYETRGNLPERAYVSALLRDLDAETEHARDRPLQSIFIGGGTPSLFSGAAIRALLDGIRARAAMAPDVEVTLEANPGAVEAQRFAEFRAAGVTRLSSGFRACATGNWRPSAACTTPRPRLPRSSSRGARDSTISTSISCTRSPATTPRGSRGSRGRRSSSVRRISPGIN